MAAPAVFLLIGREVTPPLRPTPASYVCIVTVTEESTGRTYAETLDFQVQSFGRAPYAVLSLA